MNDTVLIHAQGVQAYATKPGAESAALSCDIHADTLTCLLGAQGLRTSCLRVLGGVDPPQEGDLRLLGHQAGRLNAASWLILRRRIGFVSRTAPLLSVLNGWRNVTLPALYHRMGDAQAIEARARALLECLDYDANHGVLPAYMSYMQRQHLAIARALMLQPDVLFIDDPFNGLEPWEQDLMRTYLTGPARGEGRALVIASHDMRYVRDHGDVIVFVKPGEALVFTGWQAFIDSSDETVQAFLLSQRQACADFGRAS